MYAILIGLDIVALLLGFMLAGQLRFGDPLTPQALIWISALGPLFLILAVNRMTGDHLRYWLRGATAMLSNLAIATVLILFMGFTLRATVSASRLLLFYGVVSTASLSLLFRVGVGRLTRDKFARGISNHVLVLDDVTMAAPDDFSVIELDRIEADMNNPFLLDSLARRLRHVDHVTVACPPERRYAWSMALKSINVRADIVIPELDEIGSVGQSHVAGTATVCVSTGPLGFYDRLTKRCMDIAIAAAALAFVGPLMMIVAIAIRIDSRGPVFFRQQRVGYGNRLFTMHKFRSMKIEDVDAAGSKSAERDDARVTRVGRFIRATSIDELPQLLNVLRGEMSIVGPRPHALGSLAGDQLFWHVDVRYNHRHACKPGLTGLAQVRGFRGATHRREDLISRLQADLEYLNNWSIWRDLRIILSTFKVVVHRNAF